MSEFMWLAEQCERLETERDQAIRERDEAVAEAAGWRHNAECAADRGLQMERERNEARAAAAERNEQIDRTLDRIETLRREHERTRRDRNHWASAAQRMDHERREALRKLSEHTLSYARQLDYALRERDEAKSEAVTLRHQLADAEQAECIRECERDEARRVLCLHLRYRFGLKPYLSHDDLPDYEDCLEQWPDLIHPAEGGSPIPPDPPELP